jgi:hypothetical protein
MKGTRRVVIHEIRLADFKKPIIIFLSFVGFVNVNQVESKPLVLFIIKGVNKQRFTVLLPKQKSLFITVSAIKYLLLSIQHE